MDLKFSISHSPLSQFSQLSHLASRTTHPQGVLLAHREYLRCDLSSQGLTVKLRSEVNL